MIYFDNGATTFPKPKCVIKEVNNCIKYYCGNPGRSSHRLSLFSAEKVYEAREEISDLLSFNYPENIVFTENATHALNIAIKGLIKEPCHCIISDLEHNSVIRPLKKLSSAIGVTYSIFDSDKNIFEEVPRHIKSNTKFLISTLQSNVTGKTISLYDLSRISQKFGLSLIVDASQYIGHGNIDIAKTPCDILCAPGHKGLFGLQGVGFLVVNTKDKIETLTEGGSGFDSLNPNMPQTLPDRLEAGTLPTPSIVGLLKGVQFVKQIGNMQIQEHLDVLTEEIRNILDNKKVTVYGCESGICTFNVNNMKPENLVSIFDSENIALRNGLHCAPLIHKKLGTDKTGSVRISFSYFNTKKQLDKFYKVLKRILV